MFCSLTNPEETSQSIKSPFGVKSVSFFRRKSTISLIFSLDSLSVLLLADYCSDYSLTCFWPLFFFFFLLICLASVT